MNICVITECELARTHGTGAVILQTLETQQFHHFYFRIGHGAESEVANSTLLVDWLPNIPKLRGAVRVARDWTGVKWWNGDHINGNKLPDALRGPAAI